MMLAELDPVELIAAFTGPITAIGVIIVAIVNHRSALLAKAAATKAEESDREIKTDVKAVRHLVNSGQTQLYKTIAVITRRLAVSSKKREHVAEADEAERVYNERLEAEKLQMNAELKATAQAATP